MKRLIAAIALLACAQAGLAQLNTDNLLEPEKAFRFSARALDDAVEVHFAIADGYYLYRDRFRFSAEGNPQVRLGTPEMPRGLRHRDEFFGEVEIYRNEVQIRLPAQGTGAFELKVVSQGCADAGVCYVPMESKAKLRLASVNGAGFSPFSADTDIARLFEGNFALLIGGFLVFGLLLAFTPCVFPMIPILSGIIAGEGKRLNKSRALALSTTYVLSMAVTYALAGIAAAYAGSLIAAYLQNGWVLSAFALLFVALALAMCGLYELKVPAFLHQRLDSAQRRLPGGRMVSVAAMGALSAVIVSPCVSAPLAGALLEISRSGDVALGGAALFAMALGMGVPLIVVGVSEGALLPKAGPWMASVRKFFGVLLLAVALWVISPVIPLVAQMLGWAFLLIGSGIYLRAIDPLPADAGAWPRLWKAAGVVSVLAGAALLIGALAGSRDPLRPLAGIAGTPQSAPSQLPWTRVASVADLEAKLASAGKPAMLDFYADWCVSCKEMEAFTFRDARVRAKLDTMLLLQADVTANNEADRALLKRFSLFGPPGIIFFDADAREIKGLRVVGYQNAERFLRTLDSASR